MQRIDCFKPTSDDWCGNFKIENDVRHPKPYLVHVSFMQLSNGQYRVCVWGNDDAGMDFDVPRDQKDRARKVFVKVCPLKDVTRTRLLQMGFTWA